MCTTVRALRQSSSSARRAMTLLELMLVLALLVMIGAMAMPAFQLPFEHHRLRQAGELVRVEWSKARNKAMKTGQIQMFRYTPAAGSYQLTPYFSQQDWLEADLAHSTTAGVAGANQQLITATQAADEASQAMRELPEGVVFSDAEIAADARSLNMDPSVTASPLSGTSGPAPVLFYPDGTTSEARLVLTNQYERLYVVVSVRGLTGIVRVSQLVSADELSTLP